MVIAYGGENCKACDSSSRSNHRIPIPTLLNNCDDKSDQFVCEEGYYFSEASNKCIECIIIPPDYTCIDGYYFERCQKSLDTISCKPCTNMIPNETSQQYGPYSATPSCSSSSLLNFEVLDGVASCSLYLTPSWDEYRCNIQCKANFIDTLKGQAPLPQCVPCFEYCSPGETCYGGSSVACQPCDGPLGTNKMWVMDTEIYDTPCRSTCAHGFHYNSTEDCIPCLQNQQCFNSSEIFMGCREYNPGSCQASNVECVSGESYLFFEVYSQHAECRRCSSPVISESYVSSNCTKTRDAVVTPCTSLCPSGYYKVRNCSMISDSMCKKCTDPKTMIGMHLVEGCKGESDYSFTDCEAGKACDGSKVYDCTWPMVALKGVCKCPQGTYPVEGKCAAVSCPDGQYPDANTGECIPCTNQSPNHSITLKNVWGEDACACKNGYFIEKTHQVPPIRCWPCGDLTCAKGVQYQTPCPGILTDTPECMCRLPPGVQEASFDDKCRFSTCENGLEMTGDSVFSSMAEAAPRLWNSSFWIEDTDGVVEISLDPFISISSMIIVNQNITVLVVNHSSIWVTLFSGESGMINKDLFIFGNRNMSGNTLLDVSVCMDSVENRFWISFVMLTSICGGAEPDAGDTLILCSNLELIHLSSNPCIQDSENLCIAVPQTGLFAENIFSSWGDDIIGSGIPKKRFFSMTMQHYVNNNWLYVLVGDVGSMHASEVYKYTVHYYDVGIPHDQRNEMAFHVLSIDYITKKDIITCIVWIEDTIWALVNGYLKVLYKTKQNPGIIRISQLFQSVKLLHLSKGVREGILLAVASNPTNKLYEIDVWNGVVISRYVEFGILQVLTDFEKLVTLWQYNNKLQVTPIQAICQQDHISFFQKPCTLQPCLSLKDACGAHSLRSIGSTTCQCSPGYFLETGTNNCQICPNNAFCVGGAPPQTCPSNSFAALGAQTISQCLCERGYYKFKQHLCLACPQGFWCLGQQTPPIKCTSGSSTRSTGSQSPTECECEVRTQGIDCRPCPSSDICFFLDAAQSPKVSSIYLSGSGPMDADLTLNKTCLNWGASVVYSLPWSGLQGSVGSLGRIWTWMIVTESLPTTSDDKLLLSNISECMIQNGFFIEGGQRDLFVYTASNRAPKVQSAKSCGLNFEWSGDVNVQQCTCIAGYETVSTLNSWCSPCPPQSIRKRRSQSQCIPCLDNHSHAPWPAMDHCICKDGYFIDHESQQCIPNQLGFDSYNVISSPLIIIPLFFLVAILCILCTSFMTLRGV